MVSYSQPFQLVAVDYLPSKPTGITAVSTNPKELTLAWTPDPNAANVPIHYTVFISTAGASGPFTAVGTNLTSPNFVTTVA